MHSHFAPYYTFFLQTHCPDTSLNSLKRFNIGPRYFVCENMLQR